MVALLCWISGALFVAGLWRMNNGEMTKAAIDFGLCVIDLALAWAFSRSIS